MSERLIDKLKEYLSLSEGKSVDIRDARSHLKIEIGSKDDNNLRKLLSDTLVKHKIVSSSGKRDGIYKVVKQVKPVRVFAPDRERRPIFRLWFPRDSDTEEEMDFAENVIIREGDIVSIGGVSNYGKTALVLNMLGENLMHFPVLMGNEYTTLNSDTDEIEPMPRFLNRLDMMNWFDWVSEDGEDKFTLLPVDDDYPQHIIRDRINFIDYVDLDEHYEIKNVMRDVKSAVGRGIGVIVIQKSEFSPMARGGQFTKDKTDCELLIDKYRDEPCEESMLTIGKVKESNGRVIGRKFAFGIENGVKIINFRELKKCFGCNGSGKFKGVQCTQCWGTGYEGEGA